MAWSSHLPQLASTALASVLHAGAPEAALVAGPGLLDLTRLAMSSFDLWRDILATNRDEIDGALEALIERLKAMRGDPEAGFPDGRRFRPISAARLNSSRRGSHFVARYRQIHKLALLLPISTFVGYLMGYGLDHLFHTSWLRWVFLALGTVAGFIELLRELDKDA